MYYYLTSESVGEGHPDKLCDLISDSLLDYCLSIDNEARLAIETAVTTDKVINIGEHSLVDEHVGDEKFKAVITDVIKEVGYDQPGFSYKNFKYHNYLHQQSKEIRDGILGKELGAGDQGIMFGYACAESEHMMPLALTLANDILRSLSSDRKDGILSKLGPDSKSQVSLAYDGDTVSHISNLVVSTQHLDSSMKSSDVEDYIRPTMLECLPSELLTDETNWLVNKTGSFVKGGPDGDAGLTGRKIIVDTYGGMAPNGGGAFSGKDPTKVDRTASYFARYIAKNIVASGLVGQCLVQISYVIGVAEPTSIFVKTYDSKAPFYQYSNNFKLDQKLTRIVKEMFDFKPRTMIDRLDLCRPIYKPTATYGHFGRVAGTKGSFPWESLDLVEEIKSHF